MIVLGIESSCDETAAAILKDRKILSNVVASQDDVHAPYGGVVPELASRRHMEVIVPVIEKAILESNLKITDIEGIAVTRAPGLVGSLLIGLSAAKGIAISRGIPIVGVNHLEGHLGAVYLENEEVEEPWISLVVSGGHTSLYFVSEFGEYKLIGSTCDDAAGEGFDKLAKLLGLGYPGGPIVDRMSKGGDPFKFKFSRPKIKSSELDFSFSGMKTAALLFFKDHDARSLIDDKFKMDLCASFQNAVVQILVEKLLLAAKAYNARSIAISGGVAANSLLREKVVEAAKNNNLISYIPKKSFCTDNAAMIAYVGSRYLEAGRRDDFTLNAKANEEIGT